MQRPSRAPRRRGCPQRRRSRSSGRQFRVSRQRGELVESPLAPYVTATVHPSAILRSRDDREAELAAFVADLRKAGDLLAA